MLNWKKLSRQIPSDGTPFHKAGNGAPLVVLHGVGLRAESWHYQIEALAGDYEIFAWDMPGHGDNSVINCQTLDQYVEALHSLISNEIGASALIAGHSMGALIGVEFAAKYPNYCHGLIAMNGVFQRPETAKKAILLRATDLQEIIDPRDLLAPLERWFGKTPHGTEALAAEMCKHWLLDCNLDGYRSAYDIFAHRDGPGKLALKSLRIPSLFLTGENDRNSTPEMSQKMASLCQNGSSQVIGGASHMAMLTHFEFVNSAMRDFFNQACVARKFNPAQTPSGLSK